MESGTRLILIRHGEARAAIDRVIAGHRGCRGLSATGIQQAEALHDRLRSTGEIRADVVVSSVLPRAVHTAEIIAPALGAKQVRHDCDVCEVHPGECDGMPVDEYDRRYGFNMTAEPERPLSPGGESLVAFQQRVTAGLNRLIEAHSGQSLVIVCHGGVINVAMHWLLGAPPLHAQPPFRLEPANTSITEWARADHSGRPWLLVRYNDFAHLHRAY